MLRIIASLLLIFTLACNNAKDPRSTEFSNELTHFVTQALRDVEKSGDFYVINFPPQGLIRYSAKTQSKIMALVLAGFEEERKLSVVAFQPEVHYEDCQIFRIIVKAVPKTQVE